MIQLAVSNGNVVSLRDDAADIAAHARDFADRVEAGEYDQIESVVLLVAGSQLQRLVWGEPPSPADACFMLDLAKAGIIRDLTDDD